MVCTPPGVKKITAFLKPKTYRLLKAKKLDVLYFDLTHAWIEKIDSKKPNQRYVGNGGAYKVEILDGCTLRYSLLPEYQDEDGDEGQDCSVSYSIKCKKGDTIFFEKSIDEVLNLKILEVCGVPNVSEIWKDISGLNDDHPEKIAFIEHLHHNKAIQTDCGLGTAMEQLMKNNRPLIKIKIQLIDISDYLSASQTYYDRLLNLGKWKESVRGFFNPHLNPTDKIKIYYNPICYNTLETF
jgi:hypothetical protein